MISVSDEIKLRAELSVKIVNAAHGLDLSEAVEYADIVVDAAIKKSLNIKETK